MNVKDFKGSRLLAAVVLVVCGASPALAGDTEKWQALLAAVPRPPTQPAEALARVTARRADGKLGIDVSDPALHKFQRDVDALLQPVSAASAAIIQKNLKAMEEDPKFQEMAKSIDKTTGPMMKSETPPTYEQMKAMNAEVTRIFGADFNRAPLPANKIAAYRIELQGKQPRASSFYQRLFNQRLRFTKLHVDLDREAAARLTKLGVDASAGETAIIAKDLVAQHHALAKQQLDEANALFVEARSAMSPAFTRMSDLAREAEQRNASAGERVQAYGLFKAYIEVLLTIDRVAIEDAGFWVGVVPRRVQRSKTATGPNGAGQFDSPYAFSLAPDIDLLVTGEAAVPGAPYPPGRERRAPSPPGIR
ncbi:MAG: hypothetical protein ABL931_08545 [Usitatibacteraceae bacterium]